MEQAIAEGRRACLVAMATGTGKTRTAIGLVYRLLKAQRFRRVLFLVDRSALGEQTANALQDVRLENLQTFAEIYGIKGLDDVRPDAGTKLHIATIQGMVKRVLFPTEPADVPPVDQYDCVVVDECHRGYTLDQELSEVELRFRDQDDYVSRYRRVLDHFDAVKIGLTATPAKHTSEIFGKPVFLYAYREAVIDGCLVDHEDPVRIVTKLAREGITWQKGETMRLLDPRTAAERLVEAPDEVKIDVAGFNKQVITEGFNRAVCAELARHLDPSLPGKTLIFCANDAHADLVVKLLKEELSKHGEIENDAVQKITGHPSVERPLERIRHFKNERLPNIVVTVDLLTTGIDVPKIVNLVFLRRVESRILYEQMLGRATRLCPEIDKTVFRIFDAVALYDALQDVTSMTPVVQKPSLSFRALVEELTKAPDEEARALVLDQLVARLQRKRQILKGADATRFESIAGAPAAEVARLLKRGTPEAAAKWFADHQYVLAVLDGPSAEPRTVIVHEGTDVVESVTRGYGPNNQRPEDYLDGFRAFVTGNLNALPALVLVTQRPRDLTRAALKALKLALDEKGYTEVSLRTAHAAQGNAEIAASIMGFIRRAALGDPLAPYAHRVDNALAKILKRRAWEPKQRQWLERIAKQMKAEEIRRPRLPRRGPVPERRRLHQARQGLRGQARRGARRPARGGVGSGGVSGSGGWPGGAPVYPWA
ncbi:MAG: type I restriction-modification system endonuclease [Minicystis sp.]